MKHMAEKGKMDIKSGVLGAKRGFFGVEKIRVGNQTRKAKWCKMQVLGLKTDKLQGMKS